MARSTRWTYAASGVDTGARAVALSALLEGARYAPPPSHGRTVEAPGHFAGMVRIGRETIAVTTDTVGTKVLIAARLDRWEEVGEDLVGVNVNDLAAVGARPAGLVDTILCARPDTERFRAIGRGLGRGLRAAKCALLGGETALVPDLVGEIDLGATAVGFFPRGRRPILGDRIRPGDVLLGVPSRGFHANGFTLLRKLIAEAGLDLARPRPGERRSLGEELLAPTRIYTDLTEAVASRPEVTGLAHVSGGGVRNLARLRPGVAYVLDRWPTVPGLFRWAQELGGLPDAEAFETFNMGIGFILVTRPVHAAEVRRRLARAGGTDVVPIGHVERGAGVSVPGLGLRYDGYS